MATQPTGPGFVIGLDEGDADGGMKATLANFDIDGDELKPEHRTFLDARIVPLLRLGDDKGLSATGIASDGPPGLAERRAEAVRTYVIGRGIPEVRTWLGESTTASGRDAGARAVTVQLASMYDPALDAEIQELAATPRMPDLLAALTKMGHARLTSLRAHVAQAKGVDVGRMIVALDAVMQRESHVSEWRSMITAEALALLPLESDQRKAIEDYMNALREQPPTFKRPATPLPRVKSSNITVAGKPFRDWFNNVFLPPQQPADKKRPVLDRRWMAPIGSGFAPVFDKLPVLAGQPDVSFNAFVGYFLIIYNETGGLFISKTEIPQIPKDKLGTFFEDRYFFEPNKSTGKTTYNRPRPAGQFPQGQAGHHVARRRRRVGQPSRPTRWTNPTR